jgi:antitoxin (DNA-binding transcriptional repressor) of toxin-antitoxin stability system
MVGVVGATPPARPSLELWRPVETGRPVGIVETGRPVGIVETGRPVGIVETGRPVGIAPTGPVPGSIGALIAQFKSKVTKRINAFCCNPGHPVWQRNYYERVIRNENELSRVREYICNNPLQWALDTNNPVNYR